MAAPSNPQTGKNQVMVVEAGWPRAAVLVLWASAGSATLLMKTAMLHLVKEKTACVNHTSF